MKQIPLTQGQVALVDDEDYDWLMQWKWRFHDGYAIRTERLPACCKRPTIRMHRQILNVSDPTIDVDHINMNRADNRRCNLRLATSSENKCNRPMQSNNTTGYKGVSWDSRKLLFRARIHIDHKEIWLGYFSSAKTASDAYVDAARFYHGEFARV